jgi:hypothetical protein
MAKRTRRDVDDDAIPPQHNSLRELGFPKRIKRNVNAAANKENLLLPPKSNNPKLAQIPAKRRPNQSLARGTRKAKQPRLTVLQPKQSITTLLNKHPVSTHITKSDLYDDENWVAQQQELFTAVLNDILKVQCSPPSLWDRVLLEKFRKKAFEYYETEVFQSIVKRLNNVYSLECLFR